MKKTVTQTHPTASAMRVFMSDPELKESNTWLTKLGQLLLREPQDRQQLMTLLRDAEQRQLFNADALAMLEGVLQVSDMRVGDVKIGRDKMVTLQMDQTTAQHLKIITQASHSRFPLLNAHGNEVMGIVHAKDVLKLMVAGQPFHVSTIMRKPTFIPESKRLDVLLKEFRVNRNHMAIVVDEYGSIVGLITIEDVLEQIVGDIRDEFDACYDTAD